MKKLHLVLIASLALSATAVYADAGADLLKSKGCLGCHDMEKKKVGPAFKDVAAKYKGDKAKAPEIAAKIQSGKGHPKINASEAEIKAAVETVLSSK